MSDGGRTLTPPFACKTCGTGVDECMRLRGQTPTTYCCDECKAVGSHYDHILTTPARTVS